ncbi:MAG TPA: CvpA family protein [Bacteroidales bacterium]|nr:CvpA family protein [Bacteroidales bacterium]HLN53288.1 CvpA family protein [Lentimicrobium sp.]
MNEIDIAIGVIIILGAVQGVFKGFILSIASLVGLILGYYLSIRFAWYFEELLTKSSGNSSMLIHILSFIICFSLVMISVHFIGRTLQRVLELTPLGCLNRIAGALFGAFKGLLIVSAIIYLIEIADRNNSIISKENKEASVMYKPMAKLIPSLIPQVKKGLQKHFHDEN